MKDTYIKFSIDAALTLGLKEAVLLEALKSFSNESDLEKLDPKIIHQQIPFLEIEEIEELLQKLKKHGLFKGKEKKNIKLSKNKKLKKELVMGLKEDRKETVVTKNWVPNDSILEQAKEYGIEEDFVLSQIEDFNLLHSEKGDTHEAWDTKFLRYTIKQWRLKEISDYKDSKRRPIDKTWLPNEDAVEILLGSNINKEFIEKEIPEFILYWGERGEFSDAWNSKFIAHIRRQWAKEVNIIENSELPHPIDPNWLPNQDFYDVLALTKIDKEFATSLISEFILYWRESGQAHNSWNSKFLQQVKYQWQKEEKYKDKVPLEEIEKRVEASWGNKGLEDPNLQKIEKQSRKEVSLNLRKLKEKYKI